YLGVYVIDVFREYIRRAFAHNVIKRKMHRGVFARKAVHQIPITLLDIAPIEFKTGRDFIADVIAIAEGTVIHRGVNKVLSVKIRLVLHVTPS
ncbi:unnamed protein product, partial [marine sediment metagenome]